MKPLAGAGAARMTFTRGSDPEWSPRARSAFEFLRRHASRRYSNDALMRALRAADWTPEDSTPSPFLFTVEVPHHFDPDTEVKTGGTFGVLFQLNDGAMRGMLAVAETFRRQGVGSALLDAHVNLLGTPSMWVHRVNVPAQQFLLNNGLTVQNLNANGVLRFGSDDSDD